MGLSPSSDKWSRYSDFVIEVLEFAKKNSRWYTHLGKHYWRIGASHLHLMDRLTGFICCDKLNKTSTAIILFKLTAWFNLLVWHKTIQTDCGPQFRSEFDKFCKNFFIHHELSSPYHPESNGLAEAAVKKNAKTLLKKYSHRPKLSTLPLCLLQHASHGRSFTS